MRLDEARKKHKLTQTALGEAVGVSQRAISSYEAGARKPSPKAVTETFTNENHNGNGLYEVVREWAAMKQMKV